MVVRESGTEVLTKHEKEWKDVCYNLKDQAREQGGWEGGGGGGVQMYCLHSCL